jgi:hypothetical protein
MTDAYNEKQNILGVTYHDIADAIKQKMQLKKKR